jgi:hypothetical protein
MYKIEYLSYRECVLRLLVFDSVTSTPCIHVEPGCTCHVEDRFMCKIDSCRRIDHVLRSDSCRRIDHVLRSDSCRRIDQEDRFMLGD